MKNKVQITMIISVLLINLVLDMFIFIAVTKYGNTSILFVIPALIALSSFIFLGSIIHRFTSNE